MICNISGPYGFIRVAGCPALEGKVNQQNRAGVATRRQLMAGAGVLLGGLVSVSRIWAEPQESMTEAQSTGMEGLLTYLHQEVEIKASAHRIYDALLDPKQFAAFTGMSAEISHEVWGRFHHVWRIDCWAKRGTESRAADCAGLEAFELESGSVFAGQV